MTGGAGVLRPDFAIILDVSTSHFDITSVSSFHMLLLGLCFGIKVSGDPVPNSEAVEGRPDIQLVPERALLFDGRRPLVTIELGYRKDASTVELNELEQRVLGRVVEKGYDAGPLPELARGLVRWGIACSGKRVAVPASGV